jgi:hypothetical protein
VAFRSLNLSAVTPSIESALSCDALNLIPKRLEMGIGDGSDCAAEWPAAGGHRRSSVRVAWACNFVPGNESRTSNIVTVVFSLVTMLMVRGLWLPHVLNEFCVVAGRWSFALYLFQNHPRWIKDFYRLFFRTAEIGGPADAGIAKLRFLITTWIAVSVIESWREWLFGMGDRAERMIREAGRFAVRGCKGVPHSLKLLATKEG